MAVFFTDANSIVQEEEDAKDREEHDDAMHPLSPLFLFIWQYRQHYGRPKLAGSLPAATLIVIIIDGGKNK